MPKRRDHNTFLWALLPAEIRLLILEEISSQKYHGWTMCAAVCKEWQAFIERKNFRRLELQTSSLDDLELLVVRPRHLVRHIYLNIELPRYTCPTCRRNAMPRLSSSNLVQHAIERLFSILATWQPAGCLILELNAYSSSDSEHWFKNYCFGSPHETVTRWHDPRHGWVNGRQVRAPPVPAIERLFSVLCLRSPQNLPVVQAVTGFVLRRQLRHAVGRGMLMAMWEKLPRLQSIVYELWHVGRASRPFTWALELAWLFEDTIPNRVKTISIFKDFNVQLEQTLAWGPLPYQDTFEGITIKLAKAFARKSHNIEHLSISFMIDARRFFASCHRLSYTWNCLQTLILTSPTLTHTAPRRDIYTLLKTASVAVLEMPRLRRMVLWNSEDGHACAVVYQRHTTTDMATLTWRGTWDLELRQDVVENWKKAVSSSCHLRVDSQVLRDVAIRSHGDAMYHLRLPDGVIHPESLRQIRQEGMWEKWPARKFT